MRVGGRIRGFRKGPESMTTQGGRGSRRGTEHMVQVVGAEWAGKEMNDSPKLRQGCPSPSQEQCELGSLTALAWGGGSSAGGLGTSTGQGAGVLRSSQSSLAQGGYGVWSRCRQREVDGKKALTSIISFLFPPASASSNSPSKLWLKGSV